MPNPFKFNASPFDCLSAAKPSLRRAHVDIGYFTEGQTIIDVGDVPTHRCVVGKGAVAQFDEGEAVTTLHCDDCFDGRGLIAGIASSRFMAAEEVLVYQLARVTVLKLIAANKTFGALLFSDIGSKLSAMAAQHDQHEMQSLTLARVDQAYLLPMQRVGTRISLICKLVAQLNTRLFERA